MLDGRLGSLRGIADAGAEIRSLVHVLPESIKWHLIVELGEPLLPPCSCSFGKEVRKGSIIRPDLSSEDLSGLCLDKDAFLDSISVGSVVGICSTPLRETCINYWDVVHTLLVEAGHELREPLEVDWVVGEVAVIQQVVDVRPLGVQR